MARADAYPLLNDVSLPWRSMLLCAALGLLLVVAMGQGQTTGNDADAATGSATLAPQDQVAAERAGARSGGDKKRQRTQSQPQSHFPAKLEARGEPMEVKIRLPHTDEVQLVELTDGSFRYLLYRGSRTESLTPEEFTRRLATDKGTPLKTLLNITTPAGMLWVAVGLLGQVLFTGRMVEQWFVSEKHKRSVVPVSFWWMSLAGGVMLMVYFIWRKDIVGVLGQSTGVLIYARNLWLIFWGRGQKREVGDADTDDTASGGENAVAEASSNLPPGVVAERGNVG